MTTPSAPASSGSHILPGRISWFGGPNDPTSGGTTASGAPVTQPGIAVYNRSTLGGWWLLKAPNGTVGLVQQTDIGPAPSTGRTFDFTSSLLQYFGYSQSNFPTDSAAQGVYIGKGNNLASVIGSYGTQISSALASLGASPKQQAAFIGQADAGAGGIRGSTFTVNASGKPASPASTSIGSEAVSAGINVPNPLSGIDSIAALLTSAQFWIRIGEGILGAALLLLGLRALTGGSGNPINLATSVAGKAAKVAAA